MKESEKTKCFENKDGTPREISVWLLEEKQMAVCFGIRSMKQLVKFNSGKRFTNNWIFISPLIQHLTEVQDLWRGAEPQTTLKEGKLKGI